jgi:hypothetical protein
MLLVDSICELVAQLMNYLVDSVVIAGLDGFADEVLEPVCVSNSCAI